jgi:NAD+ synthase
VPASIVRKAPTAGLWSGQTDEGEIGITYAELDAVLERLVECRMTGPEAIKAGSPPAKVKRIAAMIRDSEFKRKLPPIAKLSSRSVGHDFLYPYDWGK